MSKAETIKETVDTFNHINGNVLGTNRDHNKTNFKQSKDIYMW